MSSTSSTTPQWVYDRILAFFNKAQSVADILDGTIQDDPSNGPGNTLGQTVAKRILDARNQLPGNRFTNFSQIDAVQGVGPDTVRDLIYSFGIPADEFFLTSMYADTIFANNWKLEYDRSEITDLTKFQTLGNDEEALRNWIVARIESICTERNISKQNCKEMSRFLGQTYMDSYFNSTMEAAYAFALWFYEHDADNWFSWEKIQEKTIPYFEYHRETSNWGMELRIFKGFVQKGIIPPGITPPDLYVVLNELEQTVSLWFSALYD